MLSEGFFCKRIKFMKNKKNLGILLGLVSAVLYGTNPLFGVPLIRAGFQVDSMLFFRFLLGAILLFLIIVFRKISLKITKQQFLSLALLGFLFAFSAESLFKSFKFISAGVASTVLFLYPIFTAIIMRIFFKERLNRFLFFAMLVSFLGVAILFKGDANAGISILGFGVVTLSALSYAFYIVCVKKLPVDRLDSMLLTFYAMSFAAVFMLLKTIIFATFQVPQTWFEFYNVASLAIFSTALSIGAISYSIKYSGATIAAILGAFEPLTAVFLSVFFLGEAFSISFGISIILILSSVFLIVLGANDKKSKVLDNPI